MADVPKPQSRRLVLLVWILVAIFYFYLSFDYIRVSTKDRNLGEYLDYVIQLAANEHRPAKEIRDLILVKGEELGLPLSGDQVVIRGSGQTLNVIIEYTADIEIPIFERVIYRKKFHHEVKYHSPG